MPYSLKGRKVLVTAGSRGLGAVICEKFADEGAHIMVNYVSREDKAQEVVARVKERGVQAFMVQGVSERATQTGEKLFTFGSSPGKLTLARSRTQRSPRTMLES